MLAYFDNSATTRPSDGVIARMERAMRDEYFNPSSPYAPAMIPEKEMNRCRDDIRASLSAKDARVIFTSGGTEANNLALIGAVEAKRPPWRVAVSAAEHPSVLEAAASLEARGAYVCRLRVDACGRVDMAQLKEELDKGLTLVSCMQVNNETGALLDTQALSALVRAYPDTLLHVDGVQGFLREPVDFRLFDMYTLSAHKIHGPKGVGALVVKKGVRLCARGLGGGQEDGLRSGTENTPGILGLAQAVSEMRALGDFRSALMQKKRALVSGIMEAVPELIVNGPAAQEGACHIVNLSFPGVRGEVMLHALEDKGVLCATGSACSSKKKHISPVLLAMGIAPAVAECALRFSLSPYTTDEEISIAARAVAELYPALKRFQRR